MKTGCAILVACLGSLALGCSSAEEEPAGVFVEKVAPVTMGGFVVFTGVDAMKGTVLPTPAKYMPCVTCHGDAGQGTLVGPESRHTPIAFSSHVIRNGRLDANGVQTGMVANPAAPPPPVGGQVLTDAEIAEISNWLNSHPKPASGAVLYKDFCGNCHGKDSPTGGSVGVKLNPGIATATVNGAVRSGLGTLGVSPRINYMPAFDAALLTDAELGLIAQFIGAK